MFEPGDTVEHLWQVRRGPGLVVAVGDCGWPACPHGGQCVEVSWAEHTPTLTQNHSAQALKKRERPS